jgi:hypothetical protein
MAMNADAIAGFGLRRLDTVLQARLAELPECRIDLEYGFVSGMCGYRRVSRGETIEYLREHALDPNADKSRLMRRCRMFMVVVARIY